ncbi:hypothetical protein BCF59_0466 [Mycoplasmopsis mustelae]|uniref:Uncharacterized protein n=1 Tax=Mycoplasmopsis mustelae TaxID=171289 RepID=A0A4R7UF20_9BACT|nr:hypothetical protein [Mycoplasmopsis mustelae]TDV24493.1 hypothetical protein BCF59_0466 [Mycoplasmopsis mustelae]
MIKKLSKDKIILIVLLSVTTIALIIGIVLTVLGSQQYINFVNNAIKNGKKIINISEFIYGIFLLILSVLLYIVTALFANSQFNKKINQNV